MPFKPVIEEKTSLPEVPFINEWKRIKANDGVVYEIRKILVSQKGLLCFFEDFKVFIWKSSKMHNLVIQSMGEGYSPEKPVESFCVQVCCDVKDLFIPGFNDETLGHWESDNQVYTFIPSIRVPSQPLVDQTNGQLGKQGQSKQTSRGS